MRAHDVCRPRLLAANMLRQPGVSLLARPRQENAEVVLAKTTHKLSEQGKLGNALSILIELPRHRLPAQDADEHLLGSCCTQVFVRSSIVGAEVADEPDYVSA